MGTGSSKSKNAGGNKTVVANVVIPGKSEPIKVSGQLDSTNSQTNDLPSGGGQAQVKKVAPNKYSLQLGEKSVGTFDVLDAGGDFATYLANASELTITNIQEAGEDETDGTSKSIQIQLDQNSKSSDSYTDDEDWEDVIDGIDDSSSSSTSPSDAGDGGGRKTKLKNELKKKRAFLSQEEYEQMIANHKQEVELMNLLREKERERQKFTLANKVAHRKRRRMARKAEKMALEALKEGKGEEEDQRLQTLQQEMDKAKTQFESEMASKSKMMTDAECEVIMATHKKKMAELQEEMEEEEKKRKMALTDKLAERKEMRKKRKAEKEEQKRLMEQQQKAKPASVSVEDKRSTSDLKREIEQKEAQFQSEVEAKKNKLSADEYNRLLAQHQQEIARLKQTLEKSTERQRQSFQDKLAARRMKRKGGQGNKPMTPEEIRQLEMELEHRQAQFDADFHEKRSQLSEEEYKKLIEGHKRELTEMKERLDSQRERQRQTLLEKLAAKRNADKKQSEPMTADEVQEAQLALNQLNMDFKTELKEAKQGKKTAEECQRLIDEHKAGMEEMQALLEKEKKRMQDGLMAKLEARKNKQKEADKNPMTQEELKQLQLVIDQKEEDFKHELKSRKGKTPEKELQAMIKKHRKEQEERIQLLNAEKARMEEAMKDQVAARKRFRKSITAARVAIAMVSRSNSQESNDELQETIQELDHKKAEFEKEEQEMRPLLSNEEYKRLIENHRKELNELEQKLNLQRMRQHQTLLDKLAARRMKRGQKESPSPMTSDEVKELQLALNQKAVAFRNELADARKTKSSEEVKKIMEAHQMEMESAQQQLDREKERMQAGLMAKLEARKQKRATAQSSSKEDQAMSSEDLKQLQLLIDKKDADFKQELRSKKGKISDKEYQKVLDKHNQEMVNLQNMLEREKLRMDQKLKNKLAARRRRAEGKEGEEDQSDAEVKELERQIELKMATLAQDAKQLRPLLSDEEYDQLLAQHKRELQELKHKLETAMNRQKQNFEDKLAARRARRKRLENEEEEKRRLQEMLAIEILTEEEVQELITDVNRYDTAVTTQIHSQRGKMTQAQCDKLISDHHKTMEALNAKLDRQLQRMGMVLADKLAARMGKEEEEESSDDDSDDSEDEDELGPIVDISAISATTSLWTTPTQSSVLALVPLREEYPIRKKKQLYTDPAIFKHLDAHAIKLAQTASLVTQPSFSALVNDLVSIGSTELEKVRLIFRWITAQNCEEMDLADAVDDTPLGVLKGLYYTKITFPTLFMRMCRFVGLRCVEICGCAKLRGYQPGQLITLKDYSYSHTWNAVRIDGYWHFVDCNWGVSHIPGSVTFDPFRFEYDEHYFLADPDVIIKTHFPNDASWQLLMQPITGEEFNEAVPLKPNFFKFGFELENHKKAVVDVPNGDLDIRLKCPPGLILFCKISTVEGGREVTLNGIHFHQFVFIHQVADDVMACFLRIPEPGHYYVTLYAKRQFMEGELNLESQTEICKYYVKNHSASSDQTPLPISPADHWGPIGVSNAGLTPVTHKGGVIMCNDGAEIDIHFKRTQKGLHYVHDMTGSGMAQQQLMPYSLQRNVEDELVFTICLPQVGRYGLHISTIYPGFARPVYLCSYLIVMPVAKAKVTPFPSPPKGESYGPSLAMPSLGVSTFTHPDPFIRTTDSQVQIIFSLSSKVNLNYNLIYNPPVCTDVSKCVKQSFEGRCVTYFVTLNKPGYYHFRLEGKGGNSHIPNTCLCNYLIRKD